MKPTDTILGAARSSAGAVLQWVARQERVSTGHAPQDVQDYVLEVYRLAPLVGIDPAIVVAQAVLETDKFRSPRWINNRNPAGLGIAADDDPDPATFTGTEAARVHIWALRWTCRRGFKLEYFPMQLPAKAQPFVTRWITKFADPACRTVVTIDDLNVRYTDRSGTPQATWAWDAAYADKLVARGNAIFPELPDQAKEQPMAEIVFGKVPHPPFQRKIVTNAWWNDLGPRNIVGVAQHSMVGHLKTSYEYILPVSQGGHGASALWDYSVGGSTDGPDLDGVIWMHNDPRGRRAGWANGGSDGLEGDGPLFVRTLGIDAINRDLVSIERSDGGLYNTQPMSPKQFESICALTAYWFDQAKVPWNTFPLNPRYGCVTHILHFEFATKECPFPPVRNEIDRIQNRVRAILKQHQTQAAVEPTVPPPLPVKPNHAYYPNGWTAKELKVQFGVLPRRNPGGSFTNLHFAVTKNPIAAIANAWVARAAKDGMKKVIQLPKPQLWIVQPVDEDNKADMIFFEGKGKGTWTLFRPHTDVPWTWAS